MSSKSLENDKYEVLEKIGHGSFGVIHKVRRKSDGLVLCRKEISYVKMSPKEREQLSAELSILKELRHKNIVAYFEREHFKASQLLHLYMEYCGNGDLGQYITSLKSKHQYASEDFVWNVLTQLATALYRCHYGEDPPELEFPTTLPKNLRPKSTSDPPTQRLMILHRDLKPENVFLDQNNSVKLGDFGLSKILQCQGFAETYVGTPFYMSPEICNGEKYTLHSDVWSLGCIIYELCARSPPFVAQTHLSLVQKIKQGKFPRIPSQFSSELQDIIAHCLNVNPTRRPNTAQLLNHPRVLITRKEHFLNDWAVCLHEKQTQLASQAEALKSEIAAQVRQECEAKCSREHAEELEYARKQQMQTLQAQFDAEVNRRVNVEVESRLASEKLKFETVKQQTQPSATQVSGSGNDTSTKCSLLPDPFQEPGFSHHVGRGLHQAGNSDVTSSCQTSLPSRRKGVPTGFDSHRTAAIMQNTDRTSSGDDSLIQPGFSTLSLHSPLTIRREPVARLQRRTLNRTPLTRAQTMYVSSYPSQLASPMDVIMADPSPVPTSSMKRSALKRFNDAGTAPNQRFHCNDDLFGNIGFSAPLSNTLFQSTGRKSPQDTQIPTTTDLPGSFNLNPGGIQNVFAAAAAAAAATATGGIVGDSASSSASTSMSKSTSTTRTAVTAATSVTSNAPITITDLTQSHTTDVRSGDDSLCSFQRLNGSCIPSNDAMTNTNIDFFQSVDPGSPALSVFAGSDCSDLPSLSKNHDGIDGDFEGDAPLMSPSPVQRKTRRVLSRDASATLPCSGTLGNAISKEPFRVPKRLVCQPRPRSGILKGRTGSTPNLSGQKQHGIGGVLPTEESTQVCGGTRHQSSAVVKRPASAVPVVAASPRRRTTTTSAFKLPILSGAGLILKGNKGNQAPIKLPTAPISSQANGLTSPCRKADPTKFKINTPGRREATMAARIKAGVTPDGSRDASRNGFNADRGVGLGNNGEASTGSTDSTAFGRMLPVNTITRLNGSNNSTTNISNGSNTAANGGFKSKKGNDEMLRAAIQSKYKLQGRSLVELAMGQQNSRATVIGHTSGQAVNTQDQVKAVCSGHMNGGAGEGNNSLGKGESIESTTSRNDDAGGNECLETYDTTSNVQPSAGGGSGRAVEFSGRGLQKLAKRTAALWNPEREEMPSPFLAQRNRCKA